MFLLNIKKKNQYLIKIGINKFFKIIYKFIYYIVPENKNEKKNEKIIKTDLLELINKIDDQHKHKQQQQQQQQQQTHKNQKMSLCKFSSIFSKSQEKLLKEKQKEPQQVPPPPQEKNKRKSPDNNTILNGDNTNKRIKIDNTSDDKKNELDELFKEYPSLIP